MSSRIHSVINIFMFVALMVFNNIANKLPLGGVTQKELSAAYQILLTPAGYVFAIWGLIYLGLTAYIILQSRPSRRDDHALRALDLPFRLSCLCNVLWLTAWHYRYVAISLIVMLGLLGSLILAYIRLDKDRHKHSAPSQWFVSQTFSIYLGWNDLATLLNVSVLFYVNGWNGAPLSPEIWTAIMVFIAFALFLFLASAPRCLSLGRFNLGWYWHYEEPRSDTDCCILPFGLLGKPFHCLSLSQSPTRWRNK